MGQQNLWGQMGAAKSLGTNGGSKVFGDKWGQQNLWGQMGAAKSLGTNGGSKVFGDKWGQQNLWEQMGAAKSLGTNGGSKIFGDKWGQQNLWGQMGAANSLGTNGGSKVFGDKWGQQKSVQSDLGLPCPLTEVIETMLSMSRGKVFPTRSHVRPAKTQISLRIRAVWSESSLSVWRRIGSLANHRVPWEDSDQPARTRRLIWVFTGRTCSFVENAVARLISNPGRATIKEHRTPTNDTKRKSKQTNKTDSIHVTCTNHEKQNKASCSLSPSEVITMLNMTHQTQQQ